MAAGAPLAPELPPLDPAFVARCIAGLLESVDGTLTADLRPRLAKLARIIEPASADAYVKDFFETCALKDGDAKRIGELAAFVLQRHQLLYAWTPEIILILQCGGYGAGWFNAYVKVGRLEQKLEEMMRQRRGETPPTALPAAPEKAA